MDDYPHLKSLLAYAAPICGFSALMVVSIPFALGAAAATLICLLVFLWWAGGMPAKP